ncbi:death domain-containing protein 1 isoform X2 [Anabas testudineus]|uniref:death domain-containing protein 1 isoform X2 n=1 Tax=Anabas testudineus TaxID=64144 RepID=UPI000E45531D|nr:death domain-containing protein 1 isoform X2 [Anabas testudineus]
MDANLHVNKETDETPRGTRSDDSLLEALTETIWGLEAVKPRDLDKNEAVGGRRYKGGEPRRNGEEDTQRRSDEGTLSPAEDDKEDEGRESTDEEQVKECKKKVLRALRELSVFHSDRVRAWRKALRECGCMFNTSPPEGSRQQQSTTAEPKSEVAPCSDSFSDTLRSVGEDVQIIMDKLSTIVIKLDTEVTQLSAGEAFTVDAAHQETSAQSEDGNNQLNARDSAVEDGGDKSNTDVSPDTDQMSDFISSTSVCNNVEETKKELEVKCQVDYKEDCVSLENHIDLPEETATGAGTVNDKFREQTKSEWITVGLNAKVEGGQSHIPDACFITASTGVAEVLMCEEADAFSFLMVTGSEELASRVIRVKVQEGANLHFPVTVAVPFCTRYRSNYRDVAVKIVDEERRTSYVTPVTTEGPRGGQRGTFAEVKVYSLGLFAVVSCLKRENYTIPRRGLSLKLSVDPRISLSYLPGSFTAPVIAQTMVQPVDAVLLAAVKSRSDAYYSVVSTSPLLYLTHPSSQPLRRPLSVTLPCPPNPEKKRAARGQKDESEHHHTCSDRAALSEAQPAPHRVRTLKSSQETSNELLTVLGSRDKQWNVLEKVHVRNQQNGLVSFELTESVERLLVVRLLSPLQPLHLPSLAEELEESVRSHRVTVVLQRRKDEPHTVLVAALPSRDLSWEQNKLRAQGYSDVLETSSEFPMCEGDQLLLHFSGNVTSTGFRNNLNVDRITFHTQRRNHLLVHLTEVDPFGNYSSPHYKGTVMFHKVTRGQLALSDKAAPTNTTTLGDPVCKLSLTLPKKVRSINRPITARVKLCEEAASLYHPRIAHPPDSLPDSLLLWLSGELSEEDTALLVLSLRLRRSTAQLVKLRAGDSSSAWAFHALAMWRRGLPAAPRQPKAIQLAQSLAKSGRPDLARELLLRQAAATGQSSLKQES